MNVMSIRVVGPKIPGGEHVLTDGALNFLESLHHQFESQRQALLQRRQEVQQRITEGWKPSFRDDTLSIRSSEWSVGDIPPDLTDRRVEITGPTDRKMMINALNSGAKVFMADFEDANSPTWRNMVEGQINLTDAIHREITFPAPSGGLYTLKPDIATLVVRPRGWHLPDQHLLVDNQQMSGSLVDFGLYVYRNAHALLEHGSAPYFYLPKLENMEEALLWENVFCFAEDALKLKRGTIKATVLVETILAAFEMDEILWALRSHIVGLNAGRWDYLFSIIKKFRNEPGVLASDRQQITMTVPFMRAYTQLLVKTAHRRGAYAIGGMAAFIPSRRDQDVNRVALAKVAEDKEREANDGFDGTWVAHPDLVPVANEIFTRVLGPSSHQRHRLLEDVHVHAEDLTDFHVPQGSMTEDGLRNNIAVAIQYIASWLGGAGAVALYHLMEDAATAEIARAQVWQWVNSQATLDSGTRASAEFVEQIIREGLEEWRSLWPMADESVVLFRQVALSKEWIDFLTLAAYSRLVAMEQDSEGGHHS